MDNPSADRHYDAIFQRPGSRAHSTGAPAVPGRPPVAGSERTRSTPAPATSPRNSQGSPVDGIKMHGSASPESDPDLLEPEASGIHAGVPRWRFNPFLAALWVATTCFAGAAIWCQAELAEAYRLSFFGFSEPDPSTGAPTQQADIARMVRLQYLPDVLGGLIAAAGACLAATLGIHAMLWARNRRAEASS
jgi:hypothetical protein